MLPARLQPRAAFCCLRAVGLVVLPALNSLSRFLVAGAWVSTCRTCGRCVSGSISAHFSASAAALWHAFGTSAELRAAIERRFGAQVAPVLRARVLGGRRSRR